MVGWGLVNASGDYVLPPIYDNLIQGDNGVVSFQRNGLWGAIDVHTGRLLFSPRFSELRRFENGVAGAERPDGLWTVVRADGTQTGENTFDLVGWFYFGLASASIGRRSGFIDGNGTLRIPFSYSAVGEFSEMRARVSKGRNALFYVTTEGHEIAGPFATALSFREGKAFAASEEWVGYIDLKGKVVLNANGGFLHGGFFSEGLASVTVSINPEQQVFIAEDGRVAIAGPFSQAMWFSEGIAAVMVGEKWGAIDRRGKFVLPPEHDSVGICRSGLVPVRNGDRYGYFNREGKLVIPFKFERARDFNFGLAAVAVDSVAK